MSENFTFELAPTEAVNDTGNMTDEDAGQPSMAHVYGLRFAPYTAFVVACVLFNILSVGAMLHMRGGRRSVHHILLLNLAACDMMGSLLLWWYYNSPLILPRFDVTTLGHCMLISLAIVAPLLLSLCNSFFSLLMLAVNQYVAICNPLWSATKVTKSKARLAVMFAWLLSIFLATLPAFLMLAMNRTSHCKSYAVEMGAHSIEIYAYGLAGLIIIIVALYSQVYRRILMYRKEKSQLRRNNKAQHENNFKAFITTAILAGTLILFWLPYMVSHFISAHVHIDLIPDSFLYAKFYFIDCLPVLNFLTDPIVYGIRMKEIRAGYYEMFSRILPCCCRPGKQQSSHHGSTVRFTSVSTSAV